jgi:hypothetical protein
MRLAERARQQVLRGVRGGDRYERGPARRGRRHAVDRPRRGHRRLTPHQGQSVHGEQLTGIRDFLRLGAELSYRRAEMAEVITEVRINQNAAELSYRRADEVAAEVAERG